MARFAACAGARFGQRSPSSWLPPPMPHELQPPPCVSSYHGASGALKRCFLSPRLERAPRFHRALFSACCACCEVGCVGRGSFNAMTLGKDIVPTCAWDIRQLCRVGMRRKLWRRCRRKLKRTPDVAVSQIKSASQTAEGWKRQSAASKAPEGKANMAVMPLICAVCATAELRRIKSFVSLQHCLRFLKLCLKSFFSL